MVESREPDRTRGPLARRGGRRVGAGAGIVLAMALGLFPARSGGSEAPRYRAQVVRGSGAVTRLRSELGEERFRAVLKVSRIDFEHALRTDTLIVPESAGDSLDLAPLPREIPRLASIPRVVLVALRIQAFGAYQDGRLARWGPISSGGPGSPTAPGSYRANWRAVAHVSSVDSSWVMRWCVNLDNLTGLALHQYALPGRPASHCCIRLLEEDARWIHDWISPWTLSPDLCSVLERGTPVLVFGEYDYHAARPWMRLPADPEAASVSMDEIEAVLERLGPFEAGLLREPPDATPGFAGTPWNQAEWNEGRERHVDQ